MIENCNKKPYITRKEAKYAGEELDRKHKDKEHNVYRCLVCDHFHITTMKKEQSRNYTRFLKKRQN